MYFHFCIFSTEFRCFKTVSNRSNRSNGGRAEPMKKANENRFFMAQVHHGVDEICSNGGRAEQSSKVVGFGFVDAHVPLTLYYVSTRVDVPSQ